MRLKRFSLLVVLVFVSSIIYSQVPNDICTDAIMLTVDGSCGTYSNSGSTNSANPSVRLPCEGSNTQGSTDVWFKAIVPNSGNLTVETFEPNGGGVRNVDIELYEGICSNLTSLSCNSLKTPYNGGDLHAQVELEGIESGTTIYIRVKSNNFGNFDICASDSGYTYSCRVINVELGVQSPCNPVTNSFDQELIVHYQTDGTANYLFIGGEVVALTGSPQIVTINDLPANGFSFDFLAQLNETINFSVTECSLNSRFFGNDIIIAPQNCFFGNVPNDDCLGATQLPINSFCEGFIDDNTGATASLNPLHMCSSDSEFAQDVWYSVEVPASGDLVVNSYFLVSGGHLPIVEIYGGNCDSLNLLVPSCSNHLGSSRLSNLIPGDILYIRVGSLILEHQGEFGICIYEAEPFTNDACEDAIELSICSSSNPTIYSTHFANAEEHPTPVISCDAGSPSRDVWFRVTGVSGSLILETTEQEHEATDMIMEVFSGDCTNLTLLDCDDFSGLAQHSRIELSNLDDTDLYIRIARDGSSAGVSFGVDVIGDLTNTIDLTMDIGDDQHIRAEQTITADNTILIDGDVIYEAGNCIKLEAGFEVEDDALFEAIIDNCD